jgi:competence protein ComEC
MGVLVMPAGVAAAVLAPLGLEDLALVPMRWGLEWILFASAQVAELPGAVRSIKAPGPEVLPLLAGGALICLLWRGSARWSGLALMLAGGLFWHGAERPTILISSDAGLVGVLGTEGRALSKPRGAGFAAMLWLENDGDDASQEEAADRTGFTGPAQDRRAQINGITLRVLSGRGQAERIMEGCDADIVVATRPPDMPPRDCVLLTPQTMRETGALAVWPDGAGGWRLDAAHYGSRGRPWAVR